MPKWFHITISVLLALLAIGFSILICGEHHWGYIPCAAIAILLFGCFYGFLRLCFWAGAKIALSYVEAYQKHVRPRIEVEAIQKYIAEHPVFAITYRMVFQWILYNIFVPSIYNLLILRYE